MDMRPQIAPDQPGADWKILAAAPFAGRRLDDALPGRRSLGGKSGHPRYPLALNQATASTNPGTRPRAASTMRRPVGVGLMSPGPIGVDGLTMTAGSDRSATRSRTTASASNFERL